MDKIVCINELIYTTCTRVQTTYTPHIDRIVCIDELIYASCTYRQKYTQHIDIIVPHLRTKVIDSA